MTTELTCRGEDHRSTSPLAEDVFDRKVFENARRTDRLFAGLLAFQWLAAVVTAVVSSPGAWEGGRGGVHAHVWAAVFLGGAVVGVPVALAAWRPGGRYTRYVVAAAQALMGALLIHLNGGRIEMHFHIFGSLALLAFYRDWRVLVTASAVVAVDHMVRGLYWPGSIFGVPTASPWRWVEHTAWVAVEDVFLIRSCLQNVREMRETADRQADLSRANEVLACEVGDRQRAEAALSTAEANYRGIFENAVEGIFQTSPAGRYLSANPSLARIYGYDSPAALIADLSDIGRNLYVEPDRRGQFVRLMGEAGAVTDFESAVRRRDGAVIWIAENARAVRDEAGATLFYEGTVEEVTERKKAEQEIRQLNSRLERQLNRLNALRQIDTAITASPDLGATLTTLLDQVTAQLGIDASDVLLLDPRGQTLGYAVGRGFRETGKVRTALRMGEGYAGRAAAERRLVNVFDLRAEGVGFVRAPVLEGEGFISYYAVPLVAKGRVKGVLEVFHRAPLSPDPEWLEFLEALAGQAAIAIDSASLFDDLQRTNAELTLAYDATIEGWSRALDLRDKETEGHTRRVTDLSVRLAREMGIDGDDLVNVRRGALLHDVGKLGIPDAVLLKPGKLSDDEWVLMRRHPGYAHEWLAPITFLRPALEIPYCHHEKWDGTGYPRGLKGEEIPLSARAFAAVDIWDALRSDRPYRKGWSEEQVMEHIRSLSGTHLDPAVVAAFLRCAADGGTGKPAATRDVFEAALAATAAPGPSRAGGLTVLVAEGPDRSSHALRRALEAGGHDVLVAPDGEGAWRAVEQGRARVVIAERVMPGLDGLELCRRIRGLNGRSYPYVILTTTEGGADDRLKALHAGADDVLTVPLDLRQLEASMTVCRRIFEAQGDLERRNARLAELAATDDLTGLKNRRHFREALDAAFSLAARRRLPLSLVLLDVDHFKKYNDAFGHPAGDDVLSGLAAILREQVRPYDLVARHGGEEFALLLTANDVDGSRAVAERMRVAVESHCWPNRPVTASFGVATTPPGRLTASDLIGAADRALYHSKRRGRNLVTHVHDLHEPAPEPSPFRQPVAKHTPAVMS